MLRTNPWNVASGMFKQRLVAKKSPLNQSVISINSIWLVVSTHLKNISQFGSFPQIGMKIKNIWNHHLGTNNCICIKFLKLKLPKNTKHPRHDPCETLALATQPIRPVSHTRSHLGRCYCPCCVPRATLGMSFKMGVVMDKNMKARHPKKMFLKSAHKASIIMG